MSKRIQLVADNDRLFPVQAFFNAISSRNFVAVIQSLLGGVGAGINDVHCQFPGDLDPGEKTFKGVRFSLYDDEVVVDEQTFKRFLIAASKAHVREQPEERAALEKALSGRGWSKEL